MRVQCDYTLHPLFGHCYRHALNSGSMVNNRTTMYYQDMEALYD